jgi:phosphoserine phosphatase
MTGPERLLVTITGPDHPGITAQLAEIVAAADIRLADIEQVVVQGTLTLCLLLEFEPGRGSSRGVLKELLFAGKSLGVEVDFRVVAGPPPERARHVDFVVTVISPTVSARHLQAVSQRLAEHGANIERVQRLTDERLSAVEILCSLPADSRHPPAALKRALLDLSTAHAVDVAIQRDDIYRRSKRLVVMDMDSTLIRVEVIDELARAHGVGEEVSAITRAAMHGELDYDESLRRRVALLEGLDASVLEALAAELPLSEGAETLVRVLRRLGYRTAVLSGGFDVPARALQARLGLDYAYSNVLEVRGGKLTGQVVGEIVNAERKAALLEEIARLERISLDQAVAIGDGANDLLMLQRAGLGVAFHAKPKLREAADTALTGGLESVLYLLGIGAGDIRELTAEA